MSTSFAVMWSGMLVQASLLPQCHLLLQRQPTSGRVPGQPRVSVLLQNVQASKFPGSWLSIILVGFCVVFFEAGLWTCFLSCCKGFDEICRKFKWGSCLVCGRARHPRVLRSGRWQGHLRLVCNRFGKHDSKGGRPCWRHDAFDPQKCPLHALPADVKAAPHAFISVDLSVVGRKLVRKNLNMFAERHWRYSDLFYSLQRNRQHSNV